MLSFRSRKSTGQPPSPTTPSIEQQCTRRAMSKKRKLARGVGKKRHGAGTGQKLGQKPNQAGHDRQPRRDNPTAASSSSSSSAVPPPTIPFDPADDGILLVGEGDLSFAASLVDHHGCLDVTATVLEDGPDALAAKYPQAAANAARVEAAGCRVLYGVDVRTMGPWQRRTGRDGDHKEKAKEKEKERIGTMDRILFNFPHVGGKSTDVNRQVRYNQELLVAFFRRALPSLAPGGSIVVTLFEGEPYTLWNIRDLARHAGLQVDHSFRFRFDAYPGYHHARTLGVVRQGGKEGKEGKEDKEATEGKDDKEDKAEQAQASATAWRGEDRLARSYVFVRKGDGPPQPGPGMGKKKQQQQQKRKRGAADSSDSNEESD